jgi:hypothetical protein
VAITVKANVSVTVELVASEFGTNVVAVDPMMIVPGRVA